MSTRVDAARAYCMSILTSCQDYPYHNPAHTCGVYDRATYIAMSEGVSGEDLEDLQLACLFHDTGFSEQYEKNEHIGARIARKWLQEQWHPEDRIEKIENIIMATVLFSEPRDLLAEIIQDADLDNLGTKEEFFYSQNYLRELRTIGGIDLSECSYWQFVYNLLTKHKFHTKTAKIERKDQQEKDVEHMKKFLDMISCPVPHVEKDNMHRI